jgi:hypothetical protein
MLEEVEEMMDTHPLVQGLREGGWQEKTYKPAQTRYLQTLSGTLGLSLRGFKEPTTGYTILAFYTGSGIEGWPDVIHGGLITTLFSEAANLQVSGVDGVEFPQEHQVVVDFAESIRPGEIYSILVPPAAPVSAIEEGATTAKVGVQCLMMRMDMAPEITTEVDEITQTQTDTVAIPTRSAHNTVFAQARFYTTMLVGPEEVQEEEEEEEEKAP